MPPLAYHALMGFIVLNVVIVLVTYITLLERKFAARMQSRIGPYYVGWPHGWLQPIADAIKLMIKEDVVPTPADRVVYNLAPLVFLVPCMRSEEHTSELQSHLNLVCRLLLEKKKKKKNKNKKIQKKKKQKKKKRV